ncbi:MAG: NIPSNAP family protein [Rhodospirillales bacterium]|nr:NIPSNAP family protein [Rhodospirillales bacterium]MDE2318339.1 NIPSNAP family protein [Rhodospirillales bacterium]
MIVDIRTYKFQPGKMNAWLKLYEEHAWPLQKKHLGDCLGFYTTIEGALHQVVHIWRYESQADRETRRNALAQEPGWTTFLTEVAKLDGFISMENKLAKETPFFSAR